MMETSCPSCSLSCRIFSLRRFFIHLWRKSLLRCAFGFIADIIFCSVPFSICINSTSFLQYPEWLETNKPSLSPEDYQRYEQQAKIMGDICKLFEREGEGAADKESTFERIMDLMQKVMQHYLLSHKNSLCRVKLVTHSVSFTNSCKTLDNHLKS